MNGARLYSGPGLSLAGGTVSGNLVVTGVATFTSYVQSSFADSYAFYSTTGGARVKNSYGFDGATAATLVLGGSTATGVQVGKSGGTVGLYAATPTVRQAHIVDATDAASAITRVNAILLALETIGVLLTS